MIASVPGWILTVLFLTILTAAAFWIAPIRRRPGPRSLMLIAFWMALLAAGHAFSHEGLMDLAYFLKDAQARFGPIGIALFVAVYAVALAIPFFPGVEIGIAIIAMFGKTGALASYSGTILGLMLAFYAGRSVPLAWRRAIVAYLRRDRHRADSAPEPAAGHRGAKRSLPRGRIGRLLLRYRYPATGIALNMPGNSAIGGGGGIALMCGMSRRFKPRWFLLTVAAATAPIPFLVLAGLIDLETLMGYRGSVHDFLTAMEPFFGL